MVFPVSVMPRFRPELIPDLEGLWWAGRNGEFAVLFDGQVGLEIKRLRDRSPKKNHQRNFTDDDHPAYRVGLTLDAAQGGPWTTLIPTIAAHRYGDENSNGPQHYSNLMFFKESIVLDGEFTLFNVIANSRNNDGLYDIWGNDPGNYVGMRCSRHDRLDTGKILMRIGAGNSLEEVASNLPSGPLLLEITRNESDEIHVIANGTPVTSATPVPISGTLILEGVGYDYVGSSQFDEYRWVDMVVKGRLSQENRVANRNYWNNIFQAY